MSITTELREWARDNTVQGEVLTTHPAQHPVHGTLESLLAIADRIDAEHEKAAAGCIHYDPERHYCAVHGDTENGWVRLPVDADGVPIRVGDRVEYLTGGRDIVRFVTLNGDGWTVNERSWKPCTMRRITPPTVEDVLDEFFGKANLPDGTQTRAEIIAEYAAKLRLAGDGE